MKITGATFTRKYNVGQYESEDYTLTAIIDDNENATNALIELKEVVDAAFNNKTAVETKSNPSKAKATPAKKSSKVVDLDEDEEDIVEEEDVVEEEDEVEEEEEEEEEEVKPKAKPKAKAKSTAKKSKEQNYDREVETHKELFGEVLAEVAPKWKSSAEGKAKVKTCSIKLNGQPFLDVDGEVLESFKLAVKKHMTAKKK